MVEACPVEILDGGSVSDPAHVCKVPICDRDTRSVMARVVIDIIEKDEADAI